MHRSVPRWPGLLPLRSEHRPAWPGHWHIGEHLAFMGGIAFTVFTRLGIRSLRRWSWVSTWLHLPLTFSLAVTTPL